MATPAERLAEARDALHQLRIGKSVVTVHSAEGDSITYTAADRADLRAYVDELAREAGEKPTRRAIGVSFR